MRAKVVTKQWYNISLHGDQLLQLDHMNCKQTQKENSSTNKKNEQHIETKHMEPEAQIHRRQHYDETYPLKRNDNISLNRTMETQQGE